MKGFSTIVNTHLQAANAIMEMDIRKWNSQYIAGDGVGDFEDICFLQAVTVLLSVDIC